MYKDLITFCENIDRLRTELIDKGYVSESGEPVFPIQNRTPTQNKNLPVTTSYVRCITDEDLELLSSFDAIEILGTKAEVDEDSGKTKKYESAYSRDPVVFIDSETGEEVTYTPPKWHGDFA